MLVSLKTARQYRRMWESDEYPPQQHNQSWISASKLFKVTLTKVPRHHKLWTEGNSINERILKVINVHCQQDQNQDPSWHWLLSQFGGTRTQQLRNIRTAKLNWGGEQG